MAGTITHEWNGTVLTITSDSGTSSADLKGEKGDMGVRGAQGVAGDGVGVDMSEYAKKEDIPDTSGFLTEAQVLALIEAKIPECCDEVAY